MSQENSIPLAPATIASLAACLPAVLPLPKTKGTPPSVLNGVHLNPHGWAHATDGKVLFRVAIPNAQLLPPPGILLHPDAVKAMKPWSKMRDVLLCWTLSEAGDQATTAWLESPDGAKLPLPLIDAAYPHVPPFCLEPYSQEHLDRRSPAAFGLDGEYLAKVAAFFDKEKLRVVEAKGYQFQTTDPYGLHCDRRAVIMPITLGR